MESVGEKYNFAYVELTLLTIDKEQTIDFYCKLGFVVVSKNLLLREPSIYLNLYEGTPENVAHRKEGDELDLLFSIQVEEIAPIKQQLLTNNIPIENGYDIPVGEYLYIRDTNGYRICIYELFVP